MQIMYDYFDDDLDDIAVNAVAVAVLRHIVNWFLVLLLELENVDW